MYLQHFGLDQEPFSIAPDPRWLYLRPGHEEALAHLRYGLQGAGGVVVLTGEIGTGKTTLCRHFIERLPAHCRLAYIFNPRLDGVELLQTVCEEFHIPLDRAGGAAGPRTIKSCIDPLNRFLLLAHAQGDTCVLLIDEAQQLSADVLEQLRLLTNLETNQRKLLRIMLIGQPELRDMLARPGLEQLAQRVVARCHLGPLSAAESADYVLHRLRLAGLRGDGLFEPGLAPHIHRLSGGVPRRINLLCDRALLGAFGQGRTRVDLATLQQAALEVSGRAVGEILPVVAEVAAPRPAPLPVLPPPALPVPPPSGPFPAARLPRGVLAAWVLAAALGSAALTHWAMSATGPGLLQAQAVPALRASPLPKEPATAGVTPPAAAPRAASVPEAATGPASAAPGAAGSASPTAAGLAPQPLASAPAVLVALQPAPAPVALAARQPASAPDALSLEPEPLTAAELRAGMQTPVTQAAALRALARRWKADLGPGEPCQLVRRQQLHCHPGRAGLPMLRLLDRPVVLMLQPGAGTAGPQHVVLSGLGAEHALVDLDGRTRRLPLAVLAEFWRGEFMTLWRVPAPHPGGKPDRLSPELAEWLNAQLPPPTAAAQGRPASLAQRVAAFQVTQGLRPDGVPGPRVVMALNRLHGVPEPRLQPLP